MSILCSLQALNDIMEAFSGINTWATQVIGLHRFIDLVRSVSSQPSGYHGPTTPSLCDCSCPPTGLNYCQLPLHRGYPSSMVLRSPTSACGTSSSFVNLAMQRSLAMKSTRSMTSTVATSRSRICPMFRALSCLFSSSKHFASTFPRRDHTSRWFTYSLRACICGMEVRDFT
jgi:hypothetical protein